MKKLLLLIGLVVFFNVSNLFAKENDGKPIDIETVKKLGNYEPIEEFPEGMMQQFNMGCDQIECKAQKAGSEVYYRFVKAQHKSAKYPGKMIQAMAWYEVLFNKNLKDSQLFIKRYLNNYPNTYKEKKIDEQKIRSIINMNKGRKKMREALGMNIELKTDIAIKRFWILGEFLGRGKQRTQDIDSDLKERKVLVDKYKNEIQELKTKLSKKNEALE